MLLCPRNRLVPPSPTAVITSQLLASPTVRLERASRPFLIRPASADVKPMIEIRTGKAATGSRVARSSELAPIFGLDVTHEESSPEHDSTIQPKTAARMIGEGNEANVAVRT